MFNGQLLRKNSGDDLISSQRVTYFQLRAKLEDPLSAKKKKKKKSGRITLCPSHSRAEEY